ncbi:MAG TPA: hypothetical protein VFE65_33635 [Pseudonocardia sp.]|nr:hypothetical protein [Pseudonocardia sp.]
MLTRAKCQPPPAARARRIVATVAVLCVAGIPATWTLYDPPQTQRVATTSAPHLVAFSVPTKHPKHSQDSWDDEDSNSSGDTSDSGNTSVSNTVNGREVGGARTYNNHTDTYGDSD